MPLEIVPTKNEVRPEVSTLPAPPKASWKLAPTTSERKSNCLRIGIWCDDGCTLAPTAGIGDFVCDLVAALLSLKESIEVVMLVHPGDQAAVKSLRNHAAGRLQIVPSVNAKTKLIHAAREARKTITGIVHRRVGRAVSFLRRSL